MFTWNMYVQYVNKLLKFIEVSFFILESYVVHNLPLNLTK